MSIAILGGGVEGQAVAQYFAKSGQPIHIFNNFTKSDLPSFQLEDFKMVFRSPSVHPDFNDEGKLPVNWTSITRYFFDHCPATIIGVTGTKGKGTTCSLIASILRAVIKDNSISTSTNISADTPTNASVDAPTNKPSTPAIHLVGNIGTPALSVLDKIKKDDIIVYEMSSFQLWDLQKSPHIAVVTRIEPDHLDVHDDFDDYVNAKANITKHQTKKDCCIYYRDNENSVKIANFSPGTKLPYPPDEGTDSVLSSTPDFTSDPTSNSTLDSISGPTSNQSSTPSTSSSRLALALDQLHIPGPHNRENATAALLACACFFHLSLDEFLEKYQDRIYQGLADFKGLPHRLEFVRELGGVEYYDDNYSSAFPALDVAVKTFENSPTILIAGGKDRGLDLTAMKQRIFTAPNLKKIILIGETKEKLSAGEYPSKYYLADTLEDAVREAKTFAEHLAHDYNSCLLGDQFQTIIVLMSPGAASFDMFKNFSDRGDQFQSLVKNLT